MILRPGDITVILETKLDVRDGVAWSQFDKAINRLEGGAEGPAGAAAAAAAQENGGASPVDSEDDLPESGA